MRLLLSLLIPFFLLSACDREPVPSAPVAPAPTPTSAPAIPTPAAALSTKLNNAVPPTRVAPIPTTVPPETPTTTTTPHISDADLTNAVRQAISGDPTLSPAAQRIEVTVSEGIVRLSGTLATEKEKDNLRTAVARVPGIRSIDNRVLVKN